MAPFCSHDCFHTHWRWAKGETAKWTLGWDETGPYTKSGAPMVPIYQDVFFKLEGAAGYTYKVKSTYPSTYVVGTWDIYFHHGAAYAQSIANWLKFQGSNFNLMASQSFKFYDSKGKQITHYTGEEFPEKKGQVMTVSFELNGQEFTALNGGPEFKFTEAVSFVINCDTHEEIDYYWEKLTAGGGEERECGWVADKYGLCWQVTPAKFFAEWVKDPAGLQRVTHEVWQMTKLDLAS
jgi:predicted 3-demethylubiquinone-9 3-methyltransferase (glyoxalase superfamily)